MDSKTIFLMLELWAPFPKPKKSASSASLAALYDSDFKHKVVVSAWVRLRMFAWSLTSSYHGNVYFVDMLFLFHKYCQKLQSLKRQSDDMCYSLMHA